MTKKQILEGNKLIAEFMGFIRDYEITKTDPPILFKNWKTFLNCYPRFLDSCENGIHSDDKFIYFDEEDIAFNSSWDWLTPVLQRIGNILKSDDELCRERSIYFLDYDITDMKIEDIWQTCIDFIKLNNLWKK